MGYLAARCGEVATQGCQNVTNQDLCMRDLRKNERKRMRERMRERLKGGAKQVTSH